jgi:rRNA maturation endonuclease Nob1
MLPIPPQGFERATGVVEGRRKCTACSKVYPVTDHASSKQCPFCSSTATVSISIGAGEAHPTAGK